MAGAVARGRAPVTTGATKATLEAPIRPSWPTAAACASTVATGETTVPPGVIRQTRATDRPSALPLDGAAATRRRARPTPLVAPSNGRKATAEPSHDGLVRHTPEQVGPCEATVRNTGRTPATAEGEAPRPVQGQGTPPETGAPVRGVVRPVDTRQATDDAADDKRPRRARMGVTCPETGAEARPTARAKGLVGLMA